MTITHILANNFSSQNLVNIVTLFIRIRITLMGKAMVQPELNNIFLSVLFMLDTVDMINCLIDQSIIYMY